MDHQNAPEAQPTRLILGLTRLRVTPGPGPLQWREQLVQMSDDRVEIELPPGEFAYRVWLMADGLPLLNVPVQMDPSDELRAVLALLHEFGQDEGNSNGSSNSSG